MENTLPAPFPLYNFALMNKCVYEIIHILNCGLINDGRYYLFCCFEIVMFSIFALVLTLKGLTAI